MGTVAHVQVMAQSLLGSKQGVTCLCQMLVLQHSQDLSVTAVVFVLTDPVKVVWYKNSLEQPA